jgi:LAS superfamily LD-carboxypeptidase LdcB
LSKRAGAYKSEKRKKEVMRQKKQEAKRHKRVVSGPGTEEEGTGTAAAETGEQTSSAEPAAENAEIKDEI